MVYRRVNCPSHFLGGKPVRDKKHQVTLRSHAHTSPINVNGKKLPECDERHSLRVKHHETSTYLQIWRVAWLHYPTNNRNHWQSCWPTLVFNLCLLCNRVTVWASLRKRNDICMHVHQCIHACRYYSFPMPYGTMLAKEMFPWTVLGYPIDSMSGARA